MHGNENSLEIQINSRPIPLYFIRLIIARPDIIPPPKKTTKIEKERIENKKPRSNINLRGSPIPFGGK